MLFTPFNVRKFVDTLGQDQSVHARNLLSECITFLVRKNHRCRPRAGGDYYRSVKKLRKRFENAVRAAERKAIQNNKDIKYPDPPDIYFFKPDRKFYYDSKHFLRWTDRIFAKASNEHGKQAIYEYLKSGALSSKNYESCIVGMSFNPDVLDKKNSKYYRRGTALFPG